MRHVPVLLSLLILLGRLGGEGVLAAPQDAFPAAVHAGQEWRYRGTATRTETDAGDPEAGDAARRTVRLTSSALILQHSGGEPRALRFRQAEGTPESEPVSRGTPHGSLVWLSNTPPPLLHSLYGRTDERQAWSDALSLPLPFSADLKPGDRREWSTRLGLPLSSPLGVLPIPGELRVFDDVLESRDCLRVELRLAQAFPLTLRHSEDRRVLRVRTWRETFWLERRSRALIRYEGSAEIEAARGRGGEAMVGRYASTLQLSEVRSLSPAEFQARRRQGTDLATVTAKVSAPDAGDAVKRAAFPLLANFPHVHPNSPYVSAAISLADRLRPEIARFSKAEALLGRAAPEFRLRDVDGGEHALSRYQGRVVLVCFFSYG